MHPSSVAPRRTALPTRPTALITDAPAKRLAAAGITLTPSQHHRA